MDLDQIITLEKAINSPTIRKDKDKLAQLIAEDFEEVGQSGRKFNKTDIIASLIDEDSNDDTYETTDFSAEQVAEAVVIVKYKTVKQTKTALRCSIWVLNPNGWQLKYHQGTPAQQA